MPQAGGQGRLRRVLPGRRHLDPEDAALYEQPPVPEPGARGRRRKKGTRLPTPEQRIADPGAYPATPITMAFGETTREFRVPVIRDVVWYSGSKTEPMTVVLVRHGAGAWRDEVLLATSSTASAEFVIGGYCRRWSIGVVFFESKQLLGFHDPCVRVGKSVERAHPMAWFVQSLTILWYAGDGRNGPQVRRDRPWYAGKKTPTFADMLGALRRQHWEMLFSQEAADGQDLTEFHNALKYWLAAVR